VQAWTKKNRDCVRAILHVSSIETEERYLGLPTTQGGMTKEKYKSMKEAHVKRFTNWTERHRSLGAKEVFIKSVAQAIPTYVMGIFKLPATLCEEME
jgi:hypothetical protein